MQNLTHTSLLIHASISQWTPNAEICNPTDGKALPSRSSSAPRSTKRAGSENWSLRHRKAIGPMKWKVPYRTTAPLSGRAVSSNDDIPFMIKIHINIISYHNWNCHIADPACVPSGDPSKTLLAPSRPPTILYSPSIATLVADDDDRVIEHWCAVIEDSSVVKLQIVPCDSCGNGSQGQLVDDCIAIPFWDRIERG